MSAKHNHTTENALFLAGEWCAGIDTYQTHNPYTNDIIGTIHLAGPDQLEQAIEAAVNACEPMRQMPAHQRSSILRDTSNSIANQAEDLAHTIVCETAKPIKQARAEVQRSVFTFAQAAEEANRIQGEVLTLDANAAGVGRQGIVRRFPIGPVSAITPFNFPLNLVAHKIAPAIAAGCPLVLKPAPQTPITALKLAAILEQCGCPKGVLSVLPMHVAHAAPLIEDDRFKLLSFTGSAVAGWGMKSRAGHKRVTLELGGNAGVIVHEDADLNLATSRIAAGGFSHAGQSCISVQRVLIHSQIYKKCMALLVPLVKALKLGDPLDEATDLSVVIDAAAGTRVAQWIEEAKEAGAEIVTGGKVHGNSVEPTIIANARSDLRVNCEEMFAPVITVQPYDTFDEALAILNSSDFGLQAGVFTHDMRRVWQAYETLQVGGVIINDVPTWRVDHMPYGGIKNSGIGREGLRYAIEEMTEPRLLVLNTAM